MPIPSEDLSILQNQVDDPKIPVVSSPDPVTEPNTDEELDKVLLTLVKYAEKEDEELRWNMLSKWKRNEFYFQNIQKIFYDDVAHDVRTIDSAVAEMQKYAPTDDIKIINIYRAYAESIIAVLSVSLPNVEFFPDDATNPDDIETAAAYSKISEFLSKKNDALLILVRGLTIMFNQGTICALNYYKTDPAFGVIQKPTKTEVKEEKVYDLYCRGCGNVLDSSVPESFIAAGSNIQCPNCGMQGTPDIYPRMVHTDEVVAWEDTPKGRSGFDIFGPTYVKLPLYARNQESCGYIILRLEDHVAKFRTVYSGYADDINSGGGDTQLFERWARVPPEYLGTFPQDITTARYAYFRPWYYRIPELKKEDTALLVEKYPNGCFITVIGDTVVDKQHCKLDDYWTISFDPRANYIHAEPAGNAIIPIQDAQTDVFNLGLQSIEYGIPETFAHPKTLNFDKYSKSPAAPGMMTPAMPPGPDKALSDGFHTVKTATLSNEYTDFSRDLNTIGQFVSAAVPSIWGGPQSGSETATEYTESRARAIQRLQLTWNIISSFWAKLTFKCVRDYATNLLEDEKYTEKKNGTFVNVWIRKSSLQGKVGNVEPELNGQLPQSWGQKKDFVMGLIQLQDPTVGSILLHPNNTELLKQITGMPDFYIPGENDRNKQYGEFYTMSSRDQQNNPRPVQIDPVIDDHPVHMQVLKNILVSPIGVNLYETEPELYQICVQHYSQHEMAQQAKTIAPSGNTAEGQAAETATATTQG